MGMGRFGYPGSATESPETLAKLQEQAIRIVLLIV